MNRVTENPGTKWNNQEKHPTEQDPELDLEGQEEAVKERRGE